ncbi:hypothetical protein GL218_09250 [Daldinia childiae]|uniref:uncharacterized protein n=1 Tax=Daldinia childiae TaxID=326645 RepID=UPI001447111A|nr:uncharacterized protein GL218_09250 [Daldinia childiae]KAF3065907.1 hypothetical protein GL218_09250 [Daldinia childiae]
MKKAPGLIALLSWRCAAAAAASSIQTKRQNPNTIYPPCTQDGYKHFLIRNWHSTTYNDSTEVFTFELQANFSGYAAPCHGTRKGDDNSGWTSCDGDKDNTSDPRFAVSFDFSSNDYLSVNHTYICDRGDTETDPHNRLANVLATGDGRLQIGLVDTPEGHFTGTEGDNMTIAAYPEVAHRLPKADCAAAYDFSEWEVREFKFGARMQAGNPWIIGTTVASINYDLYNAAIDYLINCQGVNDSVAAFPNNPDLINPKTRFPCPINYRDDLIPPEAYPKTGFKFDRRSNEVSIEQQWDCEDDDGNE